MSEDKLDKIGLIFVLMFVGIIILMHNANQKSIENKNEYAKLQSEVSKLSSTIENMNERQASLYDNVGILTEENTSLTLEIEQLREDNAKLIIASDTLQKELNSIPVETNNYAVIDMTEDERDLLAKILALEAYDQPDCGQRAVVEVVFNRVLSAGWPNTVKSVIYDKGQFATVKYLNNPYNKPRDKEYNNIDWVLTHGSTILPSDYVFFATYKANGKDFIHIQGHYFGRK